MPSSPGDEEDEDASDGEKLALALEKIRAAPGSSLHQDTKLIYKFIHRLVQEKQEAWDAKLDEMRRVNEEQYRDLEGMRASHSKQQQVREGLMWRVLGPASYQLI